MKTIQFRITLFIWCLPLLWVLRFFLFSAKWRRRGTALVFGRCWTLGAQIGTKDEDSIFISFTHGRICRRHYSRLFSSPFSRRVRYVAIDECLCGRNSSLNQRQFQTNRGIISIRNSECRSFVFVFFLTALSNALCVLEWDGSCTTAPTRRQNNRFCWNNNLLWSLMPTLWSSCQPDIIVVGPGFRHVDSRNRKRCNTCRMQAPHSATL